MIGVAAIVASLALANGLALIRQLQADRDKAAQDFF